MSGGADSLCLLHALKDRNERRRLAWELFPVHVNPGFPGWNPGRVVRACGRLGFDCRVVALDIPSRHAKPPVYAPGSSAAPGGLNPCFVCSRARRRALFETAAELGAGKVALGHHLEDVNETYLLNLLMASTSATILPRQELFQGRITIIRPLYYLEKPMVRDYLRHYRMRAARNRCPYERKSTRLILRRFLNRLYRQDRRVRTNIFWGIHNLKPQYLPTGPKPGR